MRLSIHFSSVCLEQVVIYEKVLSTKEKLIIFPNEKSVLCMILFFPALNK